MAKVGKHVPLTPNRVKAFRYDGSSRDIRWDSSPKAPGSGFGVRCYPSGKKSYVLQYRPKRLVNGSKTQLKDVRNKVRLVVIEDVESMDLSTARAKGLKLLREIWEGIDPKHDAPVEGQMLGQYLPRYLKTKERQGVGKDWLYEMERRIEKHLMPKFKDEYLSAIKRSEINDIFLELGEESPVEANKLLTHVSNLHKEAEIAEAVPQGTPNPTRNITRFPEQPRRRFLTDEEVVRLYKVLASDPSWHAPFVIQILLHQGMRKGEVLGLKWDHVRLDRVPVRECEPPHLFTGRTKNGDSQWSVLSPQMIDLFTALKEVRIEDDVWVFPSPRKQRSARHIADIKDEWERIRKEAEITDVTIHDLRHCVGTWLGRLNYTELQIGRILNHRTSSITQRYSLLPNKDKEKAVTELAEWIQDLVGPPILPAGPRPAG